MKNITFVYDDRFIVSDALKNIVGIRKYGDIIYKKKTLLMHISDILNHAPHNIKINMIVLKDLEIDFLPESDLYLYMKANYVVYNQDIFINILNKLSYIEDSYKILDDIYIFNNINSLYKIVNNIEFYIDKFKESILLFSNIENVFINIEELNNFLFFLSSGLDTRFFNQLAGNDYTITKSSSKISKIHNEYTYYQLIPDYMKVWFVMPYDYHETKDFASYKMERINATDLALKYVHNSITKHELTNILNHNYPFNG